MQADPLHPPGDEIVATAIKRQHEPPRIRSHQEGYASKGQAAFAGFKAANVLNKLPSSVQGKAKKDLAQLALATQE